MSQANELLDSLTEDEIAAYTANPATEEHIVIDSATRKITVPESLKRIAVQFDHNIETVTFDCPRYWDGIDMSTMKIYINYMRPDGKPGSCLAENVSIDESNDTIMHFAWTISGDITQIKGNLSFLICIEQSDDDGYEEYHWNSELNRDMYISEGLECEEPIITAYPAIITQLLVRMEKVMAIATPEAMQAYVDEYFDDVDSVVFVGGDSESNMDITADYVIDNEMSDTSKNAVKNNVIKAYVDESVENLKTEVNAYTDDTVANAVIDIDDSISDTSVNPVQNKVIKAYVDESVENLKTEVNAYTDNAITGVNIKIDRSEDDISQLTRRLDSLIDVGTELPDPTTTDSLLFVVIDEAGDE